MKKLLTGFLAISAIGLLTLSGCKKTGALVTSNGGTPGALTSTASTLVLDKTKVNDLVTQAITFNFTQASYGFTAAVTNTLQIDLAGDNWAKPTSVTLGAGVFSASYDTPDFNALLLKLGIAGGTTANINVRIASSISATLTPTYSNVVSIAVTPFNLKSYLYAVGAFEGWSLNAGSIDSLVSATGNGIYVGIFNFTAGNNQWLILPQKANYNNKYATTDSAPTNTTVTQNANNNLYAPSTAGLYLVTFNSNTLKISYALADYFTVIGDAAQGWGTDVPMKYVNDGLGNWTYTGTFLSTGSFKVREDAGWTYSWGIPNSGSTGAGVANTLNDSSNSNIPVATSGTHTFTFSVSATPTAMLPATVPPVLATYTFK